MTTHPLYLPAPLIPAFVAGRVTMLVEPLKSQPTQLHFCGTLTDENTALFDRGQGYVMIRDCEKIPLPHAPGDRLWLREEWNLFQFSQDGDEAWPEPKIPSAEEMRDAEELGHRYGAPQVVWKESDRARKWFSDQPWRSPVTMPKRFSRAWAEVERVEVKRVQDVTTREVLACGIEPNCEMLNAISLSQSDLQQRNAYHRAHVEPFRTLFTATHGPDAWDRNPWCTFTTIKPYAGNMEGEGC